MKLGIEQFKKVASELGPAKVDRMIADERHALEPYSGPKAAKNAPATPKDAGEPHEKVGTRVRRSELLGNAIKRRLEGLKKDQEAMAHDIVTLERKLKSQEERERHAREQEGKLKHDISAKEASAKRIAGEKNELAGENAELKEKLAEAEHWKQDLHAAEMEIKNLRDYTKHLSDDVNETMAELKRELSDAGRELATAKAESAKLNADTEALAARTREFEREIVQLTSLLSAVEKERDQAHQEAIETSEAAASALNKLLNDIEVRLPAYAQQRATDPSRKLIDMILADENLDSELREGLREILAKYL